MGVFELATVPSRPVLAAIVAHGATDVDRPFFPAHYLTWWLLPLPGNAVTAAFAVASVIHFADDLGDEASVLFHILLFMLYVSFGEARALRAVLSYLGYVHVPLHYARCVARRRWGAIATATVFTAGVWAALAHLPASALVLDALAQRTVIAHIACELSAA